MIELSHAPRLQHDEKTRAKDVGDSFPTDRDQRTELCKPEASEALTQNHFDFMVRSSCRVLGHGLIFVVVNLDPI